MSSQDQRPIRSRRELRRAREEHPEAQPVDTPAAAEAESPHHSERPNGRNRRAADVPVDAVGPAAQERSSQIRARDRAALRTIKELADKEEQLSGGGPPTRRQLRLQQLQAEVATSMNPIVPGPVATDPAPSSAEDAPAKDTLQRTQLCRRQPRSLQSLRRPSRLPLRSLPVLLCPPRIAGAAAMPLRSPKCPWSRRLQFGN